jgi:YbbR domain-containing protein
MRFESLGLKLASLGLAGLLWFVIAREKTSEIGIQVPLELQNFPRDLELTGEPVNAVEVRLRASPGIIQHLTAADISAQVDVAGATEGEQIVHLTEKAIRVPFGVRVVKITPASLTLDFERTVAKTVPVRPRLLGAPADGFEVGDLRSEPSQVVVAGPRSRVADMESVFTEPVAIEGASAAVVQDVNIGLEDPVLRVQGSPRVRVSVAVRERREERVVDGVPVEVRGGTGRTQPELVRVILGGPSAALRAMPSSEVKVWVEVQGAAGGRRPVSTSLGPGHPGITVLRVEPGEVTVGPAPRRRS